MTNAATPKVVLLLLLGVLCLHQSVQQPLKEDVDRVGAKGRMRATPASPPAHTLSLEQEQAQVQKQEQEQAERAHYSFKSSVQDGIGQAHQEREETRRGLRVEGSYSYSDGYFKRTVYYVADEGGFKVTREEMEPIGDGPEYQPDGIADVSVSVAGAENSYRVHASEISGGHKGE